MTKSGFASKQKELAAKQKIANQRLVNEAWAHLKNTGKKSCGLHDSGCFYSGSGCAFSPAIIPEFREELDRLRYSNASRILKNHSECVEEWAKSIEVNFSDILQACHDTRENDENFLFWFAGELSILIERRSMMHPPGMKEYIDNYTLKSE